MELIQKVVPVNHNLFLFGDTHLGNSHVTYTGISKLVDMVLSEYRGCSANFAVHMGDICEHVYLNDIRYRPENCIPRCDSIEKFPTYRCQILDAIGTFMPIAKNLLVMLKGNHEDKLWPIGNPTAEICDGLKVSYGSSAAKVTLVNKRGNLLYKMFLNHGRKSIHPSVADNPRRREENMRLSLQRLLREKAGDCVLMARAHTHRLLIMEPTPRLYLRDDGNTIKDAYTRAAHTDPYIPPDDRWYVSSGGFMRLYKVGEESYAERADYDPMELGFAIVRVRDRVIQGIDKVTL